MTEKRNRLATNWGFYLVLIGIALSCTYLVVHILFGINRGFDLTDEGYYLLSLQENYHQEYTLSAWYLIFRKLFFFVKLDIANVRWIRFVLVLLTSAFFSFSVWKLLSEIFGKKVIGSHFILIFGMTLLGALMAYGLFPQSSSYNDMSYYIVMMALALVLMAVLKKPPFGNVVLSYVATFLAGIIAFGAVFTKLSMAPALWVICLLVIAGFAGAQKLSGKRRNVLLSSFVVGMGVATIVSFVNGETRGFLVNLPQTLELLQSIAIGYDSQSLYSSVVEGVKGLLRMVSWAFLVYVPYHLLLSFLKQKLSSSVVNWLSAVFLFGGLYLVMSLLPKGRENYLLPLIVISAFAAIQIIHSQWHSDKRWYVLALMVFLMGAPLMFSFGTNNLLLLAAFSYIVFWFLPIALLGVLKKQPVYLVLVGCLMVLTVNLFKDTYIEAPYRQEVYAHQETSFQYGENEILIDKGRAMYLSKLRSVLKSGDFVEGDYILGFYKMPGIVYLMQGEALGGFLWDEKFASIYCANLEKDTMAPDKKIFIIKNRNPGDEITQCLNDKGVEVGSFELLDSIKTVPALRIENEWTYVYKLK